MKLRNSASAGALIMTGSPGWKTTFWVRHEVQLSNKRGWWLVFCLPWLKCLGRPWIVAAPPSWVSYESQDEFCLRRIKRTRRKVIVPRLVVLNYFEMKRIQI